MQSTCIGTLNICHSSLIVCGSSYWVACTILQYLLQVLQLGDQQIRCRRAPYIHIYLCTSIIQVIRQAKERNYNRTATRLQQDIFQRFFSGLSLDTKRPVSHSAYHVLVCMEVSTLQYQPKYCMCRWPGGSCMPIPQCIHKKVERQVWGTRLQVWSSFFPPSRGHSRTGMVYYTPASQFVE